MSDNAKTIRLDKFLSNSGLISRRGVKSLLRKEEISVNGQRARESGTRIIPGKDIIKINGEPVKNPGLVYYLLNKPIGYISTTSDEFQRDNVISLIDTYERIYPVGRLDKDTHGLILLTNDGELTHKLIHPKYHVPKTYLLTIKGKVKPIQIKILKRGVLLEDGITLPAEVSIEKEIKSKTVLKMTIHEGKNRQIRRMCFALGIELTDLKRISFGPLKLTGLKLGKYRKLSKKELEDLKKSTERG